MLIIHLLWELIQEAITSVKKALYCSQSVFIAFTQLYLPNIPKGSWKEAEGIGILLGKAEAVDSRCGLLAWPAYCLWALPEAQMSPSIYPVVQGKLFRQALVGNRKVASAFILVQLSKWLSICCVQSCARCQKVTEHATPTMPLWHKEPKATEKKQESSLPSPRLPKSRA